MQTRLQRPGGLCRASGRTRLCVRAEAAKSRPWKPVNARIVFEDGSVFSGSSFGAEGTKVGEAVFNTSITGYQEILTVRCAVWRRPMRYTGISAHARAIS